MGVAWKANIDQELIYIRTAHKTRDPHTPFVLRRNIGLQLGLADDMSHAKSGLCTRNIAKSKSCSRVRASLKRDRLQIEIESILRTGANF